MRRAYHYLPLDKYQTLVLTTGVLKPVNQIIHESLAAPFGIVNPDEKYLFCFLDTSEPEYWVTSGWLDDLKRQYKSKYAVVSFDISLDDSAYVLDATELYQFMSELGFPAESFTQELQLKMTDNLQRMKAVYERYLSSKTPLRDYSDTFAMHELIVAKEIPFSELTLEQICE
ncbi:MAG TPA: hypothetical protein VI934_02205 [Candidatus Nanoarchaeia archaeon]|nr:hypothetical protein [Candidatus Nanoarchaeia archaeon]